MSGLPLKYSPADIESGWYQWWEERGFFKPQCDSSTESEAQYYATVLPPPNVTGHLHLGHALTCSLEDAVVRW